MFNAWASAAVEGFHEKPSASKALCWARALYWVSKKLSYWCIDRDKTISFQNNKSGTLLWRPRKITLEACTLDLAKIITLYFVAWLFHDLNLTSITNPDLGATINLDRTRPTHHCWWLTSVLSLNLEVGNVAIFQDPKIISLTYAQKTRWHRHALGGLEHVSTPRIIKTRTSLVE